jgi:hypothetical protein
MSKKIFYTRVVEKLFFELVSLYTIFYAVIYALFIIFIYKMLINVYVSTTIIVFYICYNNCSIIIVVVCNTFNVCIFI